MSILEGEWLTTRQVAVLVGRRDLKELRRRLEALGVRSRRLGRFGRLHWLAEDLEAVFHVGNAGGSGGKRGALSSGGSTEPGSSC